MSYSTVRRGSKRHEVDKMVNFGAYQDAAESTAIYPQARTGSLLEISYLGLGLAGEAGESADCIKKILRTSEDLLTDEQREAQHEKLKKELGDMMWYFALICDRFGYSLSDILATNVAKLAERKEQGTLRYRESTD